MTRTLVRLALFGVLVAGCPAPAPPPSAPPPPPSGSDAPPQTQIDAGGVPTQCTGAAPGPGFECIQDCGPPVSHPGDPPPAWRWMSAEDAANRKKFGCPRCLPPDTRIATPAGDVAISELAVGARVYTLDEAGRRIEARVLYAGSSPVGRGHQLVRVTLADGRIVAGSPGHPDASGRSLGEVHVRDSLDGSRVVDVALVPFSGERTWDVLPSGPTGRYIANGVVLRSTFWR